MALLGLTNNKSRSIHVMGDINIFLLKIMKSMEKRRLIIKIFMNGFIEWLIEQLNKYYRAKVYEHM